MTMLNTRRSSSEIIETTPPSSLQFQMSFPSRRTRSGVCATNKASDVEIISLGATRTASSDDENHRGGWSDVGGVSTVSTFVS
ncbi:hypothetical protein SERLA73DRAFT_188709 [Serpula lacrymans var. lacrymans S7.3]|uniref:Uncharacterized protein n=1 Tax=Serpula lacrymans var. lacrymans (strain S7.3) TaxID=936435 RepID=F8QC06_SERL3|nr:hypothetical protein SERLA73DRAFT_188709 [Serpula lacrymans var. lacrymans S7.3]